MDRLTSARRSALMAAVRSKHTKPELLVRRVVSKLGYPYRLHYKQLPGRPDLAVPRLQKAIFVHGCFWHGHGRCKLGALPKSKLAYWRPKIAGNRARDRRNIRAMRQRGWKTLVVWQCQTRNAERLEAQVRAFLAN